MYILTGEVAGGNQKPTKTAQTKTYKNGDQVKVWFARFNVWEVVGKDKDGKIKRQLVQVVLPEREEQHKVWDHIEPGRTVQVTGNLSYRPKVVMNQQTQQLTPYVNPTIHCGASGVQLIGMPFDITASRVISFIEKREWIDEDLANELKENIKHYFSEENTERKPVREIQDNIKAPNQEEIQENLNPNKAGF